MDDHPEQQNGRLGAICFPVPGDDDDAAAAVSSSFGSRQIMHATFTNKDMETQKLDSPLALNGEGSIIFMDDSSVESDSFVQGRNNKQDIILMS